MDKLSVEVFNAIMYHLPLVDKLECNHVSKAWHKRLTNSELYHYLTLDIEKKVENAINFFKSNTIYAQRVRDLKVFSFPIEDPNTVATIMTLLPNVRNVQLYDPNPHISAPDWDENSLSSCTGAWTHLTKFTVTPAMFYATPLFIRDNLYSYLKLLDVRIMLEPAYEGDDVESRNKSKSIISNLHHAPNLETFILRNASLTLNDLETIHTALPKLKEFELSCINLLGEQSVRPTQPASNIIKFHIKMANEPCVLTHITLNTKCRWFDYFGAKYRNVQDFSVSYCNELSDSDMPMEDYDPDEESFDEEELLFERGLFRNPLHKAIINSTVQMKHLISYRNVFFGDIAKYIVDELDKNEVALNSVFVEVAQGKMFQFNSVDDEEGEDKSDDDDDDNEESDDEKTGVLSMLVPLTSSEHQVNSIQHLSVSLKLDLGEEEESQTLIKSIMLCTDLFKNLVSLTLVDFYVDNWPLSSFIFTLQNISTLESLVIDGLPVDETGFSEYSFKTSQEALNSNQIQSSNLKSLTIKNFELDVPMNKINYQVNIFFHHVLKLCTNLHTFSLTGFISNVEGSKFDGFDEDGFLKGEYLHLSFMEFKHLRSLSIDLAGFHYYIFDKLEDKRRHLWNDYYHQATLTEDLVEDKFRILNLEWSKRLDLLDLRYISPLVPTNIYPTQN